MEKSVSDKNSQLNILFTSAGRRSYLVSYFKDELMSAGKVFAANSSKISTALQIADNYVITPLIYDDNYIPFLLEYCQKNKIDAIIPLFDVDLYILACNQEKFKSIGTTVVVSDKSVIEVCNDKWKTFSFLQENGFLVPKTYICLDDVLKAIDNKIIEYPIIIKPRWGMGSISVFTAENEEELRVLCKKVKREISNTYLKYESMQSIEQAVLFQEKLNGQEYGLDIINDLRGEYQSTVVKKKIAMRSGETDCAQTRYHKEMHKLSEKLSGCLGHIANLDVDVFEDEDKLYVLEMNARFGGGYPFSHMAGVNLPKAIIAWLKSEKPENSCFTPRYNLFMQKDIIMRELHTMDSSIIIEKNAAEKEITWALNKGGSLLTPPLSQRIDDVAVWIRKTITYASAFIAQNEAREFLGVVSFYANDKIDYTAYLSLLAVEDGARGMGIGGKLLCCAEAAAKEKNMKYMRLSARKNNVNAIRFYEKNGYKYEREKHGDKDGIDMIKKL